jgi:uncharacterized protein YjbJ (UPF0337 family)
MKKKSILALLMSAVFFVMFNLSGCDSQGPAEKTGEKIDKAVESAKESVEEAGDKLTGEGTAEKIGENIDEAAEKAKNAVDPDKE